MHSKTIKTCSLPYGWQEMVKFVRESKHIIEFGGGTEIKHAHDSQVQILLDNHAINDALNHVVHPSDPFCSTSDGKPFEERIMIYVNEYSENFISNFDYTYYGELVHGKINLIKKLIEGLKFQINAVYLTKEGIEIHGLPSNRNCVSLLDNEKWGMMTSTPCWNILWIRFERIDPDGTVWVSISTWYRSHDLTDAWESNFIAQVTFIQKEILEPLNAKILFWHESNASLHIYEHNIPMAMKIKKISVSPMLLNLQKKYNSN